LFGLFGLALVYVLLACVYLVVVALYLIVAVLVCCGFVIAWFRLVCVVVVLFASSFASFGLGIVDLLMFG